MQWLRSWYQDTKVDCTRLKSLGVGPVAAATSNETEEGKAKNRRVELVKQ